MRQGLSNDGARGCAPPAQSSALFERDASDSGCAHQQGLLHDQHEGGGNDIARVTAGRVEKLLGTPPPPPTPHHHPPPPPPPPSPPPPARPTPHPPPRLGY